MAGRCAAAFGAALLAALVWTPLVRWAARRLRVVDCPDGRRKVHDRPVPLMGGVAVYLALFGTLAIVAAVGYAPAAKRLWHLGSWWNIAAASTVICLIGVLDDVANLRARTKLLGQVLAALILYAGGIGIRQVELFGLRVDLGPLGGPLTVFWLLGCMNSLNLLDGMDGLATSIGIIMSACMTVVAMATGAATTAVVASAMCGALVGFLAYNFPPATIFLGDCGSMIIGLVIGAIAIRGSLKSPATVAMILPVTLWTIPILDSFAAIVRRRLSRLPIHQPDLGHIHHRMQQAGLGRVQTLACLGGLTTLAGASVLLSLYLRQELIALVVSISIVVGLVVTRLFGHLEFSLLSDWARLRAATAAGGLTFAADVLVCMRSRLAACSTLEEAWSTIQQTAQRLGLDPPQIEERTGPQLGPHLSRHLAGTAPDHSPPTLPRLHTAPPQRPSDNGQRHRQQTLQTRIPDDRLHWVSSMTLADGRTLAIRFDTPASQSTVALIKHTALVTALMEEFRRHHRRLLPRSTQGGDKRSLHTA